MKQEHIDYLKNIGIDISQPVHPFSEEYLTVKKSNDELLIKCFEHLLLTLILDIEKIKRYNPDDHLHYLKRLRATNSSFWGQRFEIFWYASLIFRLKNSVTDLRRGKEGEEADFIFNYKGQQLAIETTSVVYELTSNMTDPISKIKGTIWEKEKKKYASKNCCLLIDYSNLSFHRKIRHNFSKTISNLIEQMNSKFGVILFHETFHQPNGGNPSYVTQVYNWTSNNSNQGLKDFIADNFTQTDNNEKERIFFRIG